MDTDNWFIESISLTKATTPPPKEEMEKLLSSPSSWPQNWEEIDRFSKDGIVNVSLAHINPDPKNEAGVSIEKSGYGIASGMVSLKPEKFDFIGHLSITGYTDKQTAKEFFDSNQNILTQGLAAPTPGASIDIPLGDLIKAVAPKETVKEFESALEKGRKELAGSGVKFEKGRYLGGEALFAVGKDGKRAIQAVLINNFVITGLFLMSDGFDSGSKRIHARRCKLSYLPESKHPPCSTLKAEGFVHKEEIEQINRSIFSRIKGEKESEEEADAELIRGAEKIKNPKEKFEVKKGDTIKTDKRTQVNIADGAGNKMWVGGGSRVKINEPSNFELMMGSLTAFLNKLKVKGKFEIHTPTFGSVWTVRGTIFSGYVDQSIASLTVIEGEVEFSDPKGNTVIVKSNQTCTYSKEHGLQKPVTLPINLKEQFKGL